MSSVMPTFETAATGMVPLGDNGTLVTEGGEYSVVFFQDTADITAAIFSFLRQIPTPKFHKQSEFKAAKYEESHKTTEAEIDHIGSFIEKIPVDTKSEIPKQILAQKTETPASIKQEQKSSERRENTLSRSPMELFAKAGKSREIDRSTHTQTKANDSAREVKRERREENIFALVANKSTTEEQKDLKALNKEKGDGQQKDKQDQQQQQKEGKKEFKVSEVKSSEKAKSPCMEDIFFRFMHLMGRILGQAEASANELYLQIKSRTDSIDILTTFMSKINNSTGDIDWSNDPALKDLVDKAKKIGVDIPDGKYKWTEDEKRLLKENIQMRKDSMEKITQLERTDMQRFMQEASQCHQARSNVLKLLKEVIDTIIHNIRP